MNQLELYALFGGSFDPVHYGHLQAIQKLQSLIGFKKFIIVPNKSSPLKEISIATPEDKVEMLKLGFSELNLAGSCFEIDEFELNSKEASYSIYSVEQIIQKLTGSIKKVPNLYFILGTDAFLDLHQWFEFKKLAHTCSFLVVSRKGYNSSSLNQQIENISKLLLLKQTTESPLASYCVKSFKVPNENPTFFEFIELDLPEVSSSEVRQAIKQGLPVENLVPKQVFEYLKSKGLYAR